MLQAPVGDSWSVEPLSLAQDGGAASDVDVGVGEIVDALVVAAVVVVVDERGDLGFEIARQEVVFQQDAVLQGLVPALDLALSHRMIGRAAQMFDLPVGEPCGRGLLQYSWSHCQTAAWVGQPVSPFPTRWPAAPGQVWRLHPPPSSWCTASKRRCNGRSRRAPSTGRTSPTRSSSN